MLISYFVLQFITISGDMHTTCSLNSDDSRDIDAPINFFNHLMHYYYNADIIDVLIPEDGKGVIYSSAQAVSLAGVLIVPFLLRTIEVY